MGEGLGAAVRGGLRTVPDYPTPGITFRDITPLLATPELFRRVVDALVEHCRRERVEAIVGVEARGFLFAAPAAYELALPLALVRKAGKLPWQTLSQAYDLEYGSATIEIHLDAVRAGQRVLIVDDVLATGGTARATCDLIEQAGAQVAGVWVLAELADLGGRAALAGWPVESLTTV